MKIIFLGCPGSGKSTQAKKLADHTKISYIEMGQIFREKANQKNELGQKIKKSLDVGILVDDEIAVSTLKQTLSQVRYKDGYVLDGYPRNEAQIQGLEPDIDMVFYINITDEEAIKRLLLRSREGETEDILAKRLEIYHKQTEPLLDFFKEKNILKEINGQKSIDEVNADVLKVYEADAKK